MADFIGTLENDECSETLEKKAQGVCMVHTNCQDPLEKKVMVTSELVIYSTKLMLKLHNVFPNAGEVLCSRKKNLRC